jgi:hypothetical protein
MDTCPICFCEFETDYAIVPELLCDCVYIVHEECWNQWNATCIYCRNRTVRVTLTTLSDVHERRMRRLMILFYLICILMFASSCSLYDLMNYLLRK